MDMTMVSDWFDFVLLFILMKECNIDKASLE